MSEHTPGPWFSERSCSGKAPDAGCGVIASNYELSISNPSRGIVAWATRHVGQTSAQVEANARLIAAAPDMLVALEECVDQIADDTKPASKLARAAIAKATGTSANDNDEDKGRKAE